MAKAREKAKVRKPITVAQAALNQVSRAGYHRPETPTPERLLQAKGAAYVETFDEEVEVSCGDKFEKRTAVNVRVRVTDGPFDRMASRGELDKRPEIHLALQTAGERYRQDWYDGRPGGMKSVDFLQEVRGTAGGMFASEKQSDAWARYSAAKDAIPLDYQSAVLNIVCYDKPVLEVGEILARSKSPKLATTIGMFALRRGLAALAIHYKIVTFHDVALPEIQTAAS